MSQEPAEIQDAPRAPDPSLGGEPADREAFIASLMDTDMYSMGAYFTDRHPDLVEDVIAQSEEIEAAGLETYADEHGIPIESCFQTLVTGLAVRYYNAVAG